jgi:hypothetical protein
VDPNDPSATLCEAPSLKAFVYFPPGIASQLTYVSIQDVTTPLNSGFDEYPVYVKIKTAPITQFPDPANRPIVVTCFASAISYEAAQRALLGHRHQLPDGSPSYFKLLPPAFLTPELAAQAEAYCGEAPTPASSVLGVSTATPLGRFLASARDFLLPRSLEAAATFRFGFAGASGSPEEFSTFGAVDAGLFSGGASGSPEEFAPPSASGPMGAATDPVTSTVTGSANEAATTGLPFIQVQTGLGMPVAGVQVTFSLQPTTRDADGNGQPDFAPAGSPALCGATTAVTGSDGKAYLECLNFGTVAGYADLKAVIDPSGLDPLACMVTALGACAGTDEAHFLVQTLPGPAATIEKVAGDNQVAPAYSDVAVPPKVRVVDQWGNPVPGVTVDWSANVGTITPYLDINTPDLGETTTGADGTTAVTSWTLGVGANTLLAETAGPIGTISVTFDATGTFTLGLANACVTGGAKDDIAEYGFYFPGIRNKVIQAIGVHLSSNGAPGASENYEVTLTATRGSDVRTATARLQSSSNSSKGLENLVIFDFESSPIPALSGAAGGQPVTVRMTAVELVNGQPQPLPSNRVINMNTGGCPAGSKNCKPVKVPEAAACDITESQLNPFIQNYRRGLAARVYTIN